MIAAAEKVRLFDGTWALIALAVLPMYASDGGHQRCSWTDGGKTTTSRVGEVLTVDALGLLETREYRTSQQERDSAGRVTTSIVGEATGIGLITNPLNVTSPKMFARTTTRYDGFLADRVTTSEPRVEADYVTDLEYDGLGRATSVTEAGGDHQTTSAYDEAGNVISTQRLPMNAETAKYDSRGLVTERTLSDGKTRRYRYDELGNLRQYLDETPSSEVTTYGTDSLGRVTRTEYPDGTSEEVVYEDGTGAVVAQRDRAGQWLSYTYDEGGRVLAVGSGQDPAAATVVVRNEYDAAGRLKRVRNKDAGIEYDEYDLLGRPSTTRRTIYRDGSGLASAPDIRDVHTQRHIWDIHDERASWRMPVAGSVVPAEDDPTSPWLQTIEEERDAGANLTRQKDANGRVMTDGVGRSVGRLERRSQWTSSATQIGTLFGYADGQTPPVELPAATPRASGLPLWHATFFGEGAIVAGQSVARDGVKRLTESRDLGVGNRRSAFGYDDRGRLTDTWLALPSMTVPVIDSLIDADFRAKRSVPSVLTASQHAQLGEELSLALEPPTWTATKTPTSHGIDERKLLLDGDVKETIDYTYVGGRRTSDGSWTYTFDEFGRVTSAASLAIGRKLDFLWGPDNRLVSRTAYRTSGAAWVLEDRASVLSADGMPADTTLVWDPVVDRLVAVYAKGASVQPGAAQDAGLVRQYLHGDQSYDDPVQVRVANVPGQLPAIYYPLTDHTGTGSLQAIVGDDGNLVERVLYADAYGDAPRYLQGPVVDKITLDATKTPTGELERVRVLVHLSEKIISSSLFSGARLASVRTDLTIAQLASPAPSLEDENTILWSLTASEWDALVNANGAASLEIAVTNTLRANGWGTTPISPIPEWAKRIFTETDSTTQAPVIRREQLSRLTTFIAGIANGETKSYETLYEMKSLYLAASDESKAKLLTGFKAAPFVDPAIGLVYFRDRWYDASTGTFLTPDAYGTIDSSNLYAYCGGDPVNCSDPTGEFGWSDVKSHSSVTWRSLKGVGRSVKKTVVGTVAGVKLIAEASDPVNFQAKLHLAQALIDTHSAVAQWGTSAGQAIVEPELITEALNELTPEEIGEEMFDAAVTTSAFVAPAARGRAAAAAAPRFRINLANTGPKIRTPVNANITIAPAAAVAPKPPGRPTWRSSEVNASTDLAGFDFVEQRSFLRGAEVPYGTPGSIRPDFTSDAMRITADVKNYNLSTAQGRYRLVQNVVEQARVRAIHLPGGYRQGLILDARGQTVNSRLLSAMVNRIVRKTSGAFRQDNIYFVGVD